MSEIEKMYENAGCELGCCKNAEYGYEGEEGTWYYCKKEDKECWTYPNGDADCVEKGYPPFTAEKLINLVMFLINKGDFNIKKGSKDITFESFTSCIAGLINNIWQDLSEEEKQQVKGILE